MRVLIFSGTHDRHRFVHQRVTETFPDHFAIVMKREETVPAPPPGLADIDRENFIRHFRDRDAVERRVYGHIPPETVFAPDRHLAVVPEDLNGPKVLAAIEKFDADIAVVFGCGMLKDPVLGALPENKINMHLGLSPWYKGGATLFWPFYFLQPQFAGVTFHQINERPDYGEIIHQVVPTLSRGDGVHDVGANTVLAAREGFVDILRKFEAEGGFNGKHQKTTGRVWRGKDFHASHLRVLYTLFDNDIVDHYLDGNLGDDQPVLFSCL